MIFLNSKEEKPHESASRTMDFPGGRPLKGRSNIVITRQSITIEDAEVAHTTAEAVELAAKYDRCFVIGGDSVFRRNNI